MTIPFSARCLIFALIINTVTTAAHAQTAEAASAVAKQILKALGRDVAEVGGEAAVKRLSSRLVAEAIEVGGPQAARVAEAQVARLVARHPSALELVVQLKALSGRGLLLLENVSDDALVAAVGALARPGVEQGLRALSTDALRNSALKGEIRLPGAGLKLVEHYGDDGAALVTRLTEDQANSVIAALRPNAIKALPSAERAKLLNALASRPDARVVNLEKTTGPLLVIAGGVVVWHGIDVTLAPGERVIEQPDGTVIREKASVGSQVAQALPQAASDMSNAAKWVGIAAVAGATVVGCLWTWRRSRKRSGRAAAV